MMENLSINSILFVCSTVHDEPSIINWSRSSFQYERLKE